MFFDISPLLFSLLLALGLNLVAFGLAFAAQTDKLTDLTYALTFALIAVLLWVGYGPAAHPYRILLAAMPLLWAVRLGAYLFIRILDKGKDDRFDGIRQVWWKFGGFFFLQGVSAWIISLPVTSGLSAPTGPADAALTSVWCYLGPAVFLLGWTLETVADWQKYRFKSQSGNANEFMRDGLFSIVRFPNYAGEILLWFGVFLTAVPVLSGWTWSAAIGPVWIAALLIGFSGIPRLEAEHEKKYGTREAFRHYQRNTDRLIPGVY